MKCRLMSTPSRDIEQRGHVRGCDGDRHQLFEPMEDCCWSSCDSFEALVERSVSPEMFNILRLYGGEDVVNSLFNALNILFCVLCK